MNAQHPDPALPEENGSEIVPDSDMLGLRSVPLDRVLQKTANYPSGQLAELGADALLRRKFGYAFWRSRIKTQLVERIVASPAAQHEPLMLALAALRTHLAPEVLTRLEEIVDPELFARLQCEQGIRPAARAGGRLAGPQVDLKISANRSSRWTFEKWARIEELGRYDFEEDGVRFRGVLLRPGDVLLSNCNLDGNGIYTTLGDPKAYSSHAALFAILSAGGRRFPAAIETYEKGVRPTPLNVFLSPRYAAHTEVYRHVNLATEHTVRVNAAAARMIREVKGYNFDTCDSARDYVSCTGVPRFVLQDAGLEPGCTKSNIMDAGIQQNLLALGYNFFDFSSPIDFVLSDEYRCVGWFDNDQVDRLVARELVEVEFGVSCFVVTDLLTVNKIDGHACV